MIGMGRSMLQKKDLSNKTEPVYTATCLITGSPIKGVVESDTIEAWSG